MPRSDSQCAADGCKARVDWKKHDKPPRGWATLAICRYTEQGLSHATLLLCERHTVKLVARQTELALTSDPKTNT